MLGVFVALVVLIVLTGAYYFIYIAGSNPQNYPAAQWTQPQTLPPQPRGLEIPTNFNGPMEDPPQ